MATKRIFGRHSWSDALISGDEQLHGHRFFLHADPQAKYRRNAMYDVVVQLWSLKSRHRVQLRYFMTTGLSLITASSSCALSHVMREGLARNESSNAQFFWDRKPVFDQLLAEGSHE
jgi:hypothetical protein